MTNTGAVSLLTQGTNPAGASPAPHAQVSGASPVRGEALWFEACESAMQIGPMISGLTYSVPARRHFEGLP